VTETSNEFLQVKVYAQDPEALRKETRPVMIAIEPHDILPIGMVGLTANVMPFNNIKTMGCVTSIAYKVPLVKHIFTWVGSGSADKENIIATIRAGFSPMICVGGAHEVIYMKNRNEYVLYLKHHLGYVKLAMQQGIDIVPTFVFGQRYAWDFFVPEASWVHSIGRKIGFIPMMFTGLWGLPMGPPKQVPLTVVLGAPIAVPHLESPSSKVLEEYNDKVIESLRRIFNENKDKHGAARCTLTIM
jgi:hypothetical protein